MSLFGDPKLLVTTHNNAFAIGLELQSFANRSDTILSGISTLNSQVYFTANVIAIFLLAGLAVS